MPRILRENRRRRAHLPTVLLLALADGHRRALAILYAAIGAEAAYALSGWVARRIYRLLDPVRLRAEGQCRAVFSDRMAEPEVRQIAEDSFVHRVWNLTDLLLADRLLQPASCLRYGGRIDPLHLAELRAAKERGTPVILVTSYYGPFDLLPIFLAAQGIRAAVVYKRHGNPAFDAFRRRLRARGGCELIPVERARQRLPEILESGGTVAILVDQPLARGGVATTFLGLPTRVTRTVGWLAWRSAADVVVAGIRRQTRPFRFAIEIVEALKSRDWSNQADPVRWITERCVAALERLIFREPSQYLWAYARWGEQLAAELAAERADGSGGRVVEGADPQHTYR